MPYYRCHECGATLHSVAGRFSANTCPSCGAPLEHADRIHIEQDHPTAMSRRFPPERSAPAAARHELKTLVWNLDEEELQVLELLVTELIANSIEHSGTGPGDSVRLDVAVTDETVRVEVRDEGSGFVPAPRTADSPLDSHWGLHLVDKLADRWEVADTPYTLVWFELDRTAGAPMPYVSSSELGAVLR